MRYRSFDLNLLVVLDTLLTKEAVGKAADSLNLSQSAVSCSLARLRDHFGDEILSKDGRKAYPTPFARNIHQEVRDILSRIENIVSYEPTFKPASSKRCFRIATSDYSAPLYLPKLTKLVTEAGGSLELEFLHISDESRKLLELGEIDLFITPERFLSREHPSEFFVSDDLVAVVASDNNAHEEVMTETDYFNAEHVAFHPPGYQRDFETFMSDRFYRRSIKIVSTSYYLMPLYVQHTALIATVPRRLAEHYANAFAVKIVELQFPLAPFVERIQWHSGRDHDDGLLWLREQMKLARMVP